MDAKVLAKPISGGQRVLFYSGDDAGAKAEVRKIIEQLAISPLTSVRLKTAMDRGFQTKDAEINLNLYSGPQYLCDPG